MAQHIVTYCDECLLEGKEVIAHTWGVTLAVPGSKAAPFETDVCDMHAQPYQAMLRHLAENGRRADRKKSVPTVAAPASPVRTTPAPAGEHVCSVCGHENGTDGGLRSHMFKEHGKTIAEAAGEAKLECPADGCGRHFKARQGVAAHLRVGHGLDLDAARELMDRAA